MANSIHFISEKMYRGEVVLLNRLPGKETILDDFDNTLQFILYTSLPQAYQHLGCDSFRFIHLYKLFGNFAAPWESKLMELEKFISNELQEIEKVIIENY